MRTVPPVTCASPIHAPRTAATGIGVELPLAGTFLRLVVRAGARRFAGRDDAVRERAGVVEREAMLAP
ncbi:hypothetical protein GCM10011314_06420 [Knoellia flava]|uniref:Uncharacterized protein n=1 Tax=Knoellia flava TaxID=913969 RepID=A0A8H9FS64_9MICO|nr:hypothetical protein GCM10011314_06420 [Knoellia flava]